MEPRTPEPPATPTRAELVERLAALGSRDQQRLGRRLQGRGGIDDRLITELTEAEERIARRRAAVPVITYPASLPITERHDELLETIRDHQVVIVAGETGSGKSTQIPKLCLELGRGVQGLIGHTQPRRVAARTIAERVADELGTELGAAVGYTVRFTDRVGDGTYIKVMTDGILLAEIQHDRLLSRYDTLIIDEAHERSLNIDFILGYLKQLLPKRPDLKIIVTSATIDTARFSEHFEDAPIIEVTGRTYPVEVRYRPFGISSDDTDDDDRDQVQAVCDAIDELFDEGPGDVLVFLSGEREIHDTAAALRSLERRHVEVLPLYARLSSAEQHRIFEPHTGRRVVLSTNVAETSLTVPGVRYVVDAGAARISRYSVRLKVQRLPIEAVSQASANQRSGRCGRVAPGVCIRLYSEEDFARRDAFTEPEILRTNLASVILQMTALGLGDVAAFPFLDPPDSRAVRDGVALLEELGALPPDQPADDRRLTPLGKRLAQLPVDPRLGRMVIEADRHGCVREILVIAAALSIQDPRERPQAAAQAAAESHRRFAVEGSDFLAYVRLWDHLREQQKALSNSQFRKLCRTEFLNYLRVREWQDLFSQLRQASGTIGVRPGSEAGHPDRVHQALLAGLLSQMGMRDGESRDFRGARGAKFAIVRDSSLSKKPPKWLMAAELVETNRLWGRVAAAIQPEWAERIGGHLVKRSYGDPRWDERGGRAVTTERVMLYGLPLVAGRQIGYDRVDPAGARAMFIRHALVQGEWVTPHGFVEHNRVFVESIRALADRTRNGVLLDDEVIMSFYDRRVGADVVSARHFDQWWKRERAKQPDLLTLTHDVLDGVGALSPSDYPDTWRQGETSFDVSYRFEPGDAADGVTVHVPLTALGGIRPDGFDWQVPGLRDELVVALVKALPKQHRRTLSPLAETSRTAAALVDPKDGSLIQSLSNVLSELGGERIPIKAFDVTLVPEHLRIGFSIEDDDGRPLAIGKDLAALRKLLGGRVRAAVVDAAPKIERTGITTWDIGDLPQSIETTRSGHVVRGYPALLDEGESVAIRVFTNPSIQARAMRGGTRKLLLLTVALKRSAIERDLSNTQRLAIGRNGAMSASELIDDCLIAAVDRIVDAHGGPVWSAADFERLQRETRAELTEVAKGALKIAGEIFVVATSVENRLGLLVTSALRPSVDDARAQLDRLIHRGFVTATGIARLPEVLRYVRGIDKRLEKLPEEPGRDQQRMLEVLKLEKEYRGVLDSIPASRRTPALADVRWMLEDLRVSIFAQSLGTARPVSPQRIVKELTRLAKVDADT